MAGTASMRLPSNVEIPVSSGSVHESTDIKDEHGENVLMNYNSSREFMCGWGAASINIITTFPLNKLIFRQQLSGMHAGSALRQLQKEGLLHLYRGVLPPLLQKSTSLSIMFGMYDQCNRVLDRRFTSVPSVVTKAASAMTAGCMEAVLTPFERIQTLLQDKYYHEKYRNTLHAFRELGQYGHREYFRGLTPILMRNGPSNAMFFLFRNDIKTFLPPSNSKGGEILRNFASGGILGALISTMFFPMNVVKAHMQKRVGAPYLSFYRTFIIVFEERNRSIRALFRGVHFNYTRSLISWGVINASYELLRSYLCSTDQCD